MYKLQFRHGIHTPGRGLIGEQDFGFCPGSPEEVGLAVACQSRCRFPDAKGKQDVVKFLRAPQFQVLAARKSADVGAAFGKDGQESRYFLWPKGHFHEAF